MTEAEFALFGGAVIGRTRVDCISGRDNLALAVSLGAR